MHCIATFHSHFGATRFSKTLHEQQLDCVLKPVPRKVSSSCGTCAAFDAAQPLDLLTGDVEALYIREAAEEYRLLWEDTENNR